MKKIITILCTCLCLCLCLCINAEGLIAINVTDNVEGYIGLKIKGQIVDIKLDSSSPNPTFNDVEIGDDVTKWFTNIPKGLTAEINNIINDDELEVEINGIVDSSEEEGSTKIEVTIPQGYIKYGTNVYEDDVSNEPSKKAKYILETFAEFDIHYYDSYEIVGEVGKEIEPQDIIVEILNCGSEADDFDYDNILGTTLPTINGLTPTITNYDDVYLTITITYTGTPTNESHDLIHTTILKENMLNKTTDRIVPDREDVLFYIVDNTTPIEPEPVDPIEPDSPSPISPREFIMPSTGVN